MPRPWLMGRYIIGDRAKILERANREEDPRRIFYLEMLSHNSYQDYDAAVGSKRVWVETWNPPAWQSGRREMSYVRHPRRQWIVDAQPRRSN